MNVIVEGLRSCTVRRQVLITFALLILFRLGFQIAVPGMRIDHLASSHDSASVLGILSLLFGGAFGSTALFALGILPHVTGLLVARIYGRPRSRAPAEFLVALSAALLVYLPAFEGVSAGARVAAILGFVAGSAFVGWIADRIDKSGVGFGVPLLIAGNFIAMTNQTIAVLSGTEDYWWGIARFAAVLVSLGLWWIALTAVAAAWSRRHPIGNSRA